MPTDTRTGDFQNCTVYPHQHYIHPVYYPSQDVQWYRTTYAPVNTTPQQGWECPNCKTIYSPFIPFCTCEADPPEVP